MQTDQKSRNPGLVIPEIGYNLPYVSPWNGLLGMKGIFDLKPDGYQIISCFCKELLFNFFLILDKKKFLIQNLQFKTPAKIFCEFWIQIFFFVTKIVKKN